VTNTVNALTTWFDVNVVDRLGARLEAKLDELTSPENLERITKALTEGVVSGLSTDIANVVTTTVSQADRVIETTAQNVAGATNSIVTNLGGQIGNVSTTIASDINSVINTLFGNLQHLIQHPFGI